MARLISTTIRLHEEDVRALKRARAAGHSASELVRKGLRVVASRYYRGRRPPSTRLFESTDTKLGEESELLTPSSGISISGSSTARWPQSPSGAKSTGC